MKITIKTLQNEIDTLIQLRNLDSMKFNELNKKYEELKTNTIQERQRAFNEWIYSVAHMNEAIAKCATEGVMK